MAVIIKRLFYRGVNTGGGGSVTAADVSYDNATSGLTATDAQAAIDELAANAESGDGYNHAFITTDWTGPSGGSYVITIPFATHKKNNPILAAYETSGADSVSVEVSYLIDVSNDIVISIPSTTDLRFSGRFIII